MLRYDLTIIYYTSNREKPEFESYIRNQIAKQSFKLHIPIISVSHKPIDFGRNICVGDVGLSDYNIYRQMQIACLEAKTKYVCTAEADCLYPPTGYFDFKPLSNWTAGHYTNLYILWKGSHIFNQKAFSLCGLFSNRKFLLSRFPRSITPKYQWRPNHKPRHPLFYKWHDWISFDSDIAIINCKTEEGMRIKSGVNTEGRPQKELPYWGKAIDLERELWKI
jgi:hypothetical protein